MASPTISQLSRVAQKTWGLRAPTVARMWSRGYAAAAGGQYLQVKTFNAISAKGLEVFSSELYQVGPDEEDPFAEN
jgi:hypothetical protein